MHLGTHRDSPVTCACNRHACYAIHALGVPKLHASSQSILLKGIVEMMYRFGEPTFPNAPDTSDAAQAVSAGRSMHGDLVKHIISIATASLLSGVTSKVTSKVLGCTACMRRATGWAQDVPFMCADLRKVPLSLRSGTLAPNRCIQ